MKVHKKLQDMEIDDRYADYEVLSCWSSRRKNNRRVRVPEPVRRNSFHAGKRKLLIDIMNMLIEKNDDIEYTSQEKEGKTKF